MNKNLFIIQLMPSEELVFKQNLTWFSVGIQNPSLGGSYEVHGSNENGYGVITCYDQSFTTPENCLMNSEDGVYMMKVVNTHATAIINVSYRY